MKSTLRATLAALTVVATFATIVPANAIPENVGSAKLLTDPFLQAPGKNSVQVVWFTEQAGSKNVVLTGDIENLTPEQAKEAATAGREGVTVHNAESFQLSRMAEDAASFVDNKPAAGIEAREVHRHEATVTGLDSTARTPYRVVSIIDGDVALSNVYTAKDEIGADESFTALLTSDHQQKNNAPANMQWAKETLGEIDATFIAGDMINVPDRASEWFDHNQGLGFFPGVQGNANYTADNGQVYNGGQIAQNSVLYTAIGNHEVQGRIAEQDSLDYSFNYPVPREVAEAEYEKVAATVNPTGDEAIKSKWIEDNSFSTTSYEEIFTLPESATGGEKYYATTVGNTRLITLFSTRIWRGLDANANPEERTNTSRYQEAADVLDSPLERGYGDFIFEDLTVDSAQYDWLQAELASPATTGAENVIVMLHESPHSLGNNAMPHFSDPVEIEEKDEAGNVIGIRYEYPAEGNVLLNSLMPLVDRKGTPVDLVFNGHSHLWNRFKSDNGVNFIETSNVGNNYGARHELSADGPRPTPPAPWNSDNYMPYGSPGGLEPIVPTVRPFDSPVDPSQKEPYHASNRYSLFTGFDSATGKVSSYIFDTENPDQAPQLFDEFTIKKAATEPDTSGSATSSLSSLGSSSSR
ncbi:metallophosphoesterase family protein [Corynebacterium sp. S7]